MVDETENTQDPHKGRAPPHNSRRHPHNTGQVRPAEKTTELKEAGLDDPDSEEDRSSHTRSRRGGRPEKKVLEEWASDPYCE